MEDAFAILWLSGGEVLASPDIRRYAWDLLRATVKARADYRDERPLLGDAAFDTLALRQETSAEGEAAQLAESLELYAAINRLPDTQLDVMVLRLPARHGAAATRPRRPPTSSASRWPPYGPPNAPPNALDDTIEPPATEGPTP
ncbi:hypothetical protein [Streptomyces achromogenes]|uniref:hypothetical protein n=1 Tax=Streptomyces achromogenes TaxID=67255 RepID=UPI0036AADB30